MEVLHTIPKWQAYRRSIDLQHSVGAVMTMGCLHAGHEALLRRSIVENDRTVLTIFVNPTQFNREEDLVHYPRTVEADLKLAEALGVSCVFMPQFQDLYPDDFRYQVVETSLSHQLEGEYRPGHFEGVMTIVLKLLQLLRPNRAYFGEKDYQQYELIRGMAEAFFIDTLIVPCPTVREENGLALSSRNTRLTMQGIELAARLNQVLLHAENSLECRKALISLGFEVDYIQDYGSRRYAAVYVEGVRLIDNVELESLKC